jgi:hypothetical protein
VVGWGLLGDPTNRHSRNDVQPLFGFNWQTLLDSADGYAFIAEVRFGPRLIDPRSIPVVATSNYSPEQLMRGMPEVKVQALKRRFRHIEMRWIGHPGQRMLSLSSHGPGPRPNPPPRFGLEFKGKRGTCVTNCHPPPNLGRNLFLRGGFLTTPDSAGSMAQRDNRH